MATKQSREIVKLIREHFRLQADVRLLASLLEAAERLNQAPHGWLKALRQGRMTPEYRNVSEQLEPQLAQFEQSLDADELNHLIEMLPPTQFVN
jgi:hypothetical protein